MKMAYPLRGQDFGQEKEANDMTIFQDANPQQRVNYLDMLRPRMTATVKVMSLTHINYKLCCLHVLQPLSFVAFVHFLLVNKTQWNNISITRPTLA